MTYALFNGSKCYHEMLNCQYGRVITGNYSKLLDLEFSLQSQMRQHAKHFNFPVIAPIIHDTKIDVNLNVIWIEH